MVISGIRTYVHAYCIRFQCEFNHDTHFVFGVTYYGYCWNEDIFICILHQISVCIQLLYLFCDQSNLIWKEFENVIFYMSEDAKLYGDVDFKQSYFTCGVQLTLYSFLSLFSYSKGVKPLNMTSNVLQKLFPHIDSPFEVRNPILHLYPEL